MLPKRHFMIKAIQCSGKSKASRTSSSINAGCTAGKEAPIPCSAKKRRAKSCIEAFRWIAATSHLGKVFAVAVSENFLQIFNGGTIFKNRIVPDAGGK